MRRAILKASLVTAIALSIAVPRASGAGPERASLAIGQVDATAFPGVAAYVTVLNDKGYPVPGLDAGRFQVTEDGRSVEALRVASAVDGQAPLSVSLVIDVSGSMVGEALELEKAAAAAFVRSLGDQDTSNLIAFSTGVAPLVQFTGDKASLVGAIESLAAGGNTALYDALFAGVEALAGAPATRRVVVLMTDGYDTRSAAALEDGINLAARQGTPVYTIGLGDDLRRDVLSRISRSTGATAIFAPSPRDLDRAYRAIGEQLRGQYHVSYTSPQPAGKRTYRLNVSTVLNGERAAAEASFTPDLVPPVITQLSLTNGALLDTALPFTVSLTAGAPVRRVAVQINGRDYGIASPVGDGVYSLRFDPAFFSPGRQEIAVTVEDAAGSQAVRRVSAVIAPQGASGQPAVQGAGTLAGAPGTVPAGAAPLRSTRPLDAQPAALDAGESAWDAVSGVADASGRVMRQAGAALASAGQSVGGVAREMAAQAKDSGEAAMSAAGQMRLALIGTAEGAGRWASDLRDAVTSAARGAGQVLEAVGDAIGGVGQGLGEVAGAAEGAGQAAGTGIGTAAGSVGAAIQDISTLPGTAAGALARGARGAVDGIRAQLKSVPELAAAGSRPAAAGGLALCLVLSAAEAGRVAGTLRRRLRNVPCSRCRRSYRAYQDECLRCRDEAAEAQAAEQSLAESLLQNNVLSGAALERALQASRASGSSLESALVESGTVSEEELQKARFYYAQSREIRSRVLDVREERRGERGGKSAFDLPLALHASVAVVAALAVAALAPRLLGIS